MFCLLAVGCRGYLSLMDVVVLLLEMYVLLCLRMFAMLLRFVVGFVK